MRIALISDIHGNLPALEAVLADLEGRAEEVWCLGDVVGYGASPNECATLVERRCSLCLAGNHDLVVRGDLSLSEFSPGAAKAARWTRGQLTNETRSFLGPLEPQDAGHEVGLYHASPRDPVWEYVLTVDQAAECMARQRRRVCFVGHTHVASWFTLRPEPGEQEPEPEGSAAQHEQRLDLAQGNWLVNPGAVGQPRDGDPRAAYLVLDTTERSASFHRVDYPVEEAAAAIIDAGLPTSLGERLRSGQ